MYITEAKAIYISQFTHLHNFCTTREREEREFSAKILRVREREGERDLHHKTKIKVFCINGRKLVNSGGRESESNR